MDFEPITDDTREIEVREKSMRPMRRIDKQLPETVAEAILKSNDHGILSMVLPDGTPYGVPINYAYDHKEIIMHAALSGQKMEALAVNPSVCFTVVHSSSVDKANLSTNYSSVMAFGTVTIILEPVQKHHYLLKLLAHYGITEQMAEESLRVDSAQTAILVIKIDQLFAKGYPEFAPKIQ